MNLAVEFPIGPVYLPRQGNWYDGRRDQAEIGDRDRDLDLDLDQDQGQEQEQEYRKCEKTESQG